MMPPFYRQDIRTQISDLEQELMKFGVWDVNDTFNYNETIELAEKITETSRVRVFYVSLVLHETEDPQKEPTTDYIVAESTEFIGMDKLTLSIKAYMNTDF